MLLEDQEYAFIFNLLQSDQVSIKGNQMRAVGTIQQKIVEHLQAKQAPTPPEVDNGDRADPTE